jgi:accessory gene regulator B
MTIELNIYLLSTIFLLCFAAVLRYAPADTEERPIVSKKLRKKLKTGSCFAVVILYMVSIYNLGTAVSSIIAFSTLFESVLILPITYKLANSMYDMGM